MVSVLTQLLHTPRSRLLTGGPSLYSYCTVYRQGFFGHTIRSPVQEDVESARRKTDSFRLEWYNLKTAALS